ncbi:hypothetical protein HPB50_000871 [Hyalomma asiaticum]|uniref:Uncharacterized protein n=1 Tax=Hyalomma asiaticum TaxID=266040 RepID=A0ACB7S4S2_HYAAI|nr:hypothetical protein HPB50_000871 [Hyalomma asiaticum]
MELNKVNCGTRVDLTWGKKPTKCAGNLEVKLNNQLELKRKGEEDYYECVKERDAHKEALRQQIDELTAKVAEKEKLQDQLQELQRQFEEYKTSAAGNNGNLSKENERLELELASAQRELQSAIAKHDELSRKVKALQEENEGLKHEAKCKKEDGSKNMQAALASFSAVMDSAKQEVHIWKEKCRKQQAYREQREKLLKQRIAEMTETIKKTSQDTEALKAQTERQSEQLTAATEERDKLASELAAMKKERDKLATERRSLEAQLNYCDAKLREYSKEAKKAPGKAVNQSLYSTPSLESVWSQRQPSRRQSSTSVASTDEFKESRFSCDEEQGFFSETAVADLGSLPDDPMGRYSELYRRNSMLPQHLRSVYPVETQQCPIPATPLRGGDTMFPFLEAPSPAAAAATSAAPSRQPQPSSTTDDTSKRKRDTRSSSSSDSNGKSSFWANVGTPSRSTKPNKSTRTPSSVKKFLRSKFKR